ncbi:hypothetical protein JCM13304A_08410 [Desulfothermus okinawensis JCM 13304]
MGKNKEDRFLRPCPLCGKIVNTKDEIHTLYDCRNFLLEKYYKERDEKKREELEARIDKINEKLGTKSKNLVDR